MAFFKIIRRRFFGMFRSELSRINMRCVIIGAIVVLICGFLSWLAAGSTTSVGELLCPRGTLPMFLLPLVWTFMYIFIGGAAGAVVCSCERALEGDKYKGLLFFVIMMVFNFVWAPLFFGAMAYFAAFMAIIMMIILTFFSICYFIRIYAVAGAVLIVYLAWLFYVAYFNLAVIILN